MRPGSSAAAPGEGGGGAASRRGSARSSRGPGGGYTANSFRTEGIVLRTHRLGEADRILEILTPGHGIVRAVAKGVRRSTSRFGSVVEPFMHSTLQIARGRKDLHTVSQAQLITPYATWLAADYELFSLAAAMAETVERVTAVDADGAQAQFRLFHGALAALSRRRHTPSLILSSFLLRTLSAAGWAPSFTDCARCGAPGPHRSLAIALGGMVCEDCRPSGSSRPAPETVGLLAALQVGDWGVADAASDLAVREAAGIVGAYLQFHVERRLVSLTVLEQMAQAAPPAPPR
ncbi:DNA repair protein RecO [Micrococcus lylae]|uniref:DNA repair protein RecO n=1 Tax=Micrococcus lylae TaxID=1273 RepID=UPI0021A444C1|nr:DNA repair protein RecO [Micrococcus lylae]MCT2006529.1 DNA repair protein RecO [Micrococcus lylae]